MTRTDSSVCGQQEQKKAFANWTANYQDLYEYLLSPNEGVVGPDCLSILPYNEQVKQLTGAASGTGEPCPEVPDADETTPLRVDWQELGFVSPVTNQASHPLAAALPPPRRRQSIIVNPALHFPV